MENILRAVGEWAAILLISFLYPYILMRITPLEDYLHPGGTRRCIKRG